MVETIVNVLLTLGLIIIAPAQAHHFSPTTHDVASSLPNSILEKYPYVVKIMLYGKHVCDGSLIYKDVVLSEAECIVGTMPFDYNKVTPFYVLLNLRAQLGNKLYPTHEVSTIVYRDQFAILKLATPFRVDQSSDSIVELAGSESDVEIFGNATAITQGAFSTFAGNTSTVDLFISPTQYCVDSLSIKSSSELCVRHFGSDYCPSHRGGPIIVNNRQVGIVSSINILGLPNPCFSAKKFGAYPSIVGARSWIDTTVKLLNEGVKSFRYGDFVINVHSAVN